MAKATTPRCAIFASVYDMDTPTRAFGVFLTGRLREASPLEHGLGVVNSDMLNFKHLEYRRRGDVPEMLRLMSCNQ
jgi:hypothetical protein